MTNPQQIAKHLNEVHFGGNWTCTNLKEVLSDVTWQQAITKIESFNSIVALTFHINYFVEAILKFLQENKLDAHDKFSFDHPPITSQQDWEKIRDKVFTDAECLVSLVEQLPENILNQNFSDPKYGSYYRNLHGVIEHTHYHMGQIVIIKKIIANEK